jgi:hypothetical protein
MPTVHVKSESEVPQGWRYHIEVNHDGARLSVHRLRLAWVDHNFWTGERPIPPSRVAQAVIEYLLAARPDDDLPDRFDAAMARRWAPAIDRELPERL